MSTKYNPLACPEAEPGVERRWDFRLIMREMNGFAFFVEKLRLVYFEKNGGNRAEDIEGTFLSGAEGPLRVSAYSAVVRPLPIPYDEDICGLGALLIGRDERGDEMTFHYYVELR